jgi:hypothetical protein
MLTDCSVDNSISVAIELVRQQRAGAVKILPGVGQRRRRRRDLVWLNELICGSRLSLRSVVLWEEGMESGSGEEGMEEGMQTLCFFDEASGDMGGADKRQGKRMRKGTEESERREERPFSFPMDQQTSIHTACRKSPQQRRGGTGSLSGPENPFD